MPYPSKRDPRVEQEVLDRLAEGEPLSVICRSDSKFPHPTVWRDWCEADEALAIAYARAREAGEDVIAEECLAIIDEPPARLMSDQGPRIDPADVHNRRLRFEGRLKLLAKWNPKRWGEKVDVTSEGHHIDRRPSEELDEVERATRIAALLAKVQARTQCSDH